MHSLQYDSTPRMHVEKINQIYNPTDLSCHNTSTWKKFN